MKFKPGQEVTPKIRASEWVTTIECMPIPEFGKIYTVSGYPLHNYPEFLTLEELEGFYYWEENFEAMVTVEQIEHDLVEVLQFQNEKEYDNNQRY